MLKVEKFIENHKLISPGDLIIIAVSGGPDSIALLDILNKIKIQYNLTLFAAHVNHSLREEADEEEQFVKNQCAIRDIPIYTRKINIEQIATEKKLTIEETGRNIRYQFFSELKKQLNANKIATAHHHDDVAETVLLHFLRGSGIKGLRGIMPINKTIIRPLLCLTKAQVLQYLDNNEIPYCVDESNSDLKYLRNRIRHELIPYLQEYNPRIIENLNQLANIAREENDIIEREVYKLWKKAIIRGNNDTIYIDQLFFNTLHPAYQRRITMLTLAQLAGESGWDMKDINAVLQLSKKEGSARTIILKKGVKVNKSYGKLVFTIHALQKVKFSYEVNIPGQIALNETNEIYTFSVLQANEFKPSADILIYLDYDKLKSPVFLRSRQEGDTFKPLGLKGTKKLKDFFIDHKVPFYERDCIPILASQNEIYAVLGFRISENVSVNENTKRILVIKRGVMEKIIK